MELLIGCPVSRREWIIESCIARAVVSAERASITPAFMFVCDHNDATFGVADKACKTFGVELYVVPVEEEREDVRRWNADRYHRMVELRNILLTNVRSLSPKFFLSLDSDILLHEDCISNLIETSETYDAVGGKAYMSEGRSSPSFGILQGDSFQRYDWDGVGRVDIIMALKLFCHKAYNVDYVWDRAGEDIGWSKAARTAGVSVGWDGRVANKHVMKREDLDKIDKRIGF